MKKRVFRLAIHPKLDAPRVEIKKAKKSAHTKASDGSSDGEYIIRLPSPLDVWTVAEEHGWHSPSATFGEDMALIHSEVSEALEAFREGRMQGDKHSVAEELADVIIRVLHVCQKHELPIEDAVWLKHEKNKNRPYRHGGKKL